MLFQHVTGVHLVPLQFARQPLAHQQPGSREAMRCTKIMHQPGITIMHQSCKMVHSKVKLHVAPAAGGTADPDGIDEAFEVVADVSERVKTAVGVVGVCVCTTLFHCAQI